MPTYEYRCADCGHTFDIVQSFTDDALTECPECGGRLKKVFGSVGIAFKGSGFYVNDSGAKKSTTSVASSASDSAGSSSGDASSTNGSDSSSSKESGSSKPKDKAKAKSSSSTD